MLVGSAGTVLLRALDGSAETRLESAEYGAGPLTVGADAEAEDEAEAAATEVAELEVTVMVCLHLVDVLVEAGLTAVELGDGAEVGLDTFEVCCLYEEGLALEVALVVGLASEVALVVVSAVEVALVVGLAFEVALVVGFACVVVDVGVDVDGAPDDEAAAAVELDIAAAELVSAVVDAP